MKAIEYLMANHPAACQESLDWVGDRAPRRAWEECKRGDWMLWIAKKQNVDIKVLTLAKVQCASLVKHLMKDERSLKALEVAEQFAQGNATREELDAAYAGAADAYADAYAYADADAAYAAAAAAADGYADAAAAYAGYAAASAADYAYAAYTAAAYAARKNILAQTADICREVIPYEMLRI